LKQFVVKFWTNNGKRGCNNPTKTSTPLPSIHVFPLYKLLKDGVIAYVNFPMSGEFWPLQEIPLFNQQYTHLAKD
jgi:hypothetical protein